MNKIQKILFVGVIGIIILTTISIVSDPTEPEKPQYDSSEIMLMEFNNEVNMTSAEFHILAGEISIEQFEMEYQNYTDTNVLIQEYRIERYNWMDEQMNYLEAEQHHDDVGMGCTVSLLLIIGTAIFVEKIDQIGDKIRKLQKNNKGDEQDE
ncbi:hypothetical protein KAU43_03625 [candidate division WOR-3 bacterium]|nr:hypothetical protein [candidate division WOR-3 bacterium]